MNIEKKILSLLEHGLNTSTLADLNAKQIEALYDRLAESKKENKEAVTKTSTTTTFDPSNEADRKTVEDMLGKKGVPVTIDPATKKITVVAENNEEEDQFTQSSKFASGEDPQQDVPQDEGPSDNMSADDGMGMFEENLDEKFESKSQQKLFFAKCGDGKTKEQKKWCKMAKEFADSTKNFSKLPEKKDETNEEFSFKDYMGKIGSVVAGNTAKNVSKTLKPTFEGKLEESIMKMINKHITPKMTKKDFIKTIMESEREVETPVKPDVDTPSRPKPATPYQPKHKPAPKAGEREVETPVKPDVDTPSRPKPATPYQPKHKPAPKAKDVPEWLTFDAIGINFK